MVCVLSHGQKGSFYGTDAKEVRIEYVTQLFLSRQAPTLAGKPKLFFIQACQGEDLQTGCVPCSLRPAQNADSSESRLEEDAGPVRGETVPDSADFLIGMATVQDYKSFRNITSGSIYIQELCRQLTKSAERYRRVSFLFLLLQIDIILNTQLCFSSQHPAGWHPQHPDACQQGGEQRRIPEPKTNARAQVHPHQEAGPQICVSWLGSTLHMILST